MKHGNYWCTKCSMWVMGKQPHPKLCLKEKPTTFYEKLIKLLKVTK